jgi:hypothetical protein
MFVYVARDKNTEGAVKIGRTENLKSRMLSIRGSLPWPEIEMLACYNLGPMANFMERKLHAQMQFPKKKYPSGRDSEWYDLTGYDVQCFITQVELLCYSETLVLQILEKSGNQEGEFVFDFPNLLVATIIELLEICRRNDPFNRLWFYVSALDTDARLGSVTIHTVVV